MLLSSSVILAIELIDVISVVAVLSSLSFLGDRHSFLGDPHGGFCLGVAGGVKEVLGFAQHENPRYLSRLYSELLAPHKRISCCASDRGAHEK